MALLSWESVFKTHPIFGLAGAAHAGHIYYRDNVIFVFQGLSISCLNLLQLADRIKDPSTSLMELHQYTVLLSHQAIVSRSN